MPQPSSLASALDNLREIPDLYALVRELRTTEPIAWCAPRQCWVVTSYKLVESALEDARLSNRRTSTLVRAQLGEKKAHLAADFERVFSRTMIMNDGKEHGRLRAHGNRGLTPRVLDRARTSMERVARMLVDRCLNKGRFDLVSDYSNPFPALVIGELFGLREIESDRFQEWSEVLATFFGATMRNPEADARAANRAVLELEEFFQELLERRKHTPGEDLMSLFLAGQGEDQLTDEEICAQCIVLLAGGHVTTTNQIANAIHALLSAPHCMAELRSQPDFVKNVVEESLRFDGAVSFVFRLASENVELGGVRISQGEMVLLGLTAANRDPDVFDNPDGFDPFRSAQRNLAFGLGAHYCMGASLARIEMEVALLEIARRMPHLRFDSELPAQRWCDSLVFRGFESLPLMC